MHVVVSCILCFAGDADSEGDFWIAPNQCGAWSVYHVRHLLGFRDEISRISAILPIDGKPKSLSGIKEALDRLGTHSFGVTFPKKRFEGPSQVGLIRLRLRNRQGDVFWHFVAVAGWNSGLPYVIDGPRGWKQLTSKELQDKWDGVCLICGADDWRLNNEAWGWTTVSLVAIGLAILSIPHFRRIRTIRRQALFSSLLAALLISGGCNRKLPPPSDSAPIPQIEPESMQEAKVDAQAMDDFNANRATGASPNRRGIHGIAEFTLYNPLTESIDVVKRPPTCNCAVLDLTEKRIAAGASTSFRLSITGMPVADTSVDFEVPWTSKSGRAGVLTGRGILRAVAKTPLLVTQACINHGALIPGAAESLSLRVETWEDGESDAWLSSIRGRESPERVTSMRRIGPSSPGPHLYSYYAFLPIHEVEYGTKTVNFNLCTKTDDSVGSLVVTYFKEPPLQVSPSAIFASIPNGRNALLRRRLTVKSTGQAIGEKIEIVKRGLPTWMSVDNEVRPQSLKVEQSFSIVIDPSIVPSAGAEFTLLLRTVGSRSPPLKAEVPVRISKLTP